MPVQALLDLQSADGWQHHRQHWASCSPYHCCPAGSAVSAVGSRPTGSTLFGLHAGTQVYYDWVMRRHMSGWVAKCHNYGYDLMLHLCWLQWDSDIGMQQVFNYQHANSQHCTKTCTKSLRQNTFSTRALLTSSDAVLKMVAVIPSALHASQLACALLQLAKA